MFFKLAILLFVSANFLFVDGRVEINIKPAVSNQPDAPRVTLRTRLGTVIGKRKITTTNNVVNVFFGVPYAVPPVGKLRFRRTRLIERLPQNPYQAVQFKPHCAQNIVRVGNIYNPNDTFSEDCLHLNIFTPNLETNKLNNRCRRRHRVIVFIPDNAQSISMQLPFLDERGRQNLVFNGEQMAGREDTILVTLNYRTGPLATLVVGRELNGNLGLWDQNLALRWVRENIEDYCGDGQNITLAGTFFGSKYTGIHLISHQSKKLIKNAIMQSDSPLFHNDQPATRNEITISSFLATIDLGCVDLRSHRIDSYLHELDSRIRKKYSQTLALRRHIRDNLVLGFSLKREILRHNRLRDSHNGRSRIDPDTLVLIRFLTKWAVDRKCLITLPVSDIVNLHENYTQNEWSIHYDSDFIDDKTVANYIKNNRLNLNPDVNLLIGSIKTEGCALTLKYTWRYPTDQFNAPRIPKDDARAIIRNETIVLPGRRRYQDILANIYTDETRWELERGYFDSVQNFVDDQYVNCPIIAYSKAAAASGANSVSHYLITQIATKHLNPESELNSYDLHDYAWLGPCESDELLYLFGAPFRVRNKFTNLDRSFSSKLIRTWTHFAKHNRMPNLTPSNRVWPTSNRRNPNPRIVEINEIFTRETDAEVKARCEIWERLLPLYKR